MTVAYLCAAPDLIQDRTRSKSTNGKAKIGWNIAHSHQGQDQGADSGNGSGDYQVAPESLYGCSLPGQEWTQTHCQDQDGEDWPIYPVIEGCTYCLTEVAKGLRDQREKGAP